MYKKLRGRIIEKYGSLKNYASEMGLTSTQISRYMNGKARFTRDKMLLWGEKLDIEKDDLGSYFFA